LLTGELGADVLALCLHLAICAFSVGCYDFLWKSQCSNFLERVISELTYCVELASV